MFKKIFLVITALYLFIILLPTTTLAQKYNFRNYTTQDGLANDLVIDLMQDKSGRIWIGTADGVSSYDGTKFKNYTTEEGLNNNRTYTVYQQFDNVFWIGTETGITKLEIKEGKDTLTPITQAPSIGAITNIFEVDNKLFFLGKSGVIKLEANSFSLIPKLPINPQMRFRSGYLDKDNNLWIGSSQGLIKLDTKSYEYIIYGENEGILATDLIRCIYQDNTGDFWLCFQESGILKVSFQNQTIVNTRLFTQKDGLPSNQCFDMLQDQFGNYWVTTYNGLVKFSDKKSTNPNQINDFQILQVYQEQNGLIHNNMNPIFQDRENNLWLGTHYGLSKLTSEKFISYDVNTGLLSNTVYKSLQDDDGDIWIATYKGVNLFSNGKFFDFSDIDPVLGTDITSIFIDSKKRLWVTQEQLGVFAFEKKRVGEKILLQKTINLGAKESIHRPINVVEDKFGQIWIADYGANLSCYDGNKISIYNSNNTKGFPESRFLSINSDSKGDIWIGLFEGALKATIEENKQPSFKYYFSEEGFSAKRVKHIYEDSKGNIWFSSESSGLFKWDGKIFTRYTTLEGLSSNNIYAVLESPKDTLWIATAKGADKFINNKFNTYNYNDGVTQKGSDIKWIMADNGGNFWFSTGSGLKKYISSLDYETKTPPKIQVETIKLNQKLLDYKKFLQLLENKPVYFPYYENSFEFNFLGLSFINEDLVSYKYKLEGYEKDWSTTKERVAKYPNLLPGTYIFNVKAINKNLLESETKTIEIYIEKPFWLQAWFLILSTLGAVAFIYGSYTFQIRKIENQKLLLETLVKKRTDEVISQKNELESKNLELGQKNQELNKKNEELIKSKEELLQSNQKVEAIFSALSNLLPGTVLDNKYRLEDKIGSGGFGIVFRATHLNLNRDVAVKVFRPTDENVTGEALERFQMEGASACRVNHPNAISILDSGITSTGIPYIVMELLTGHTLSYELRKKGYITVKRCAEILIPICNALSKAHAAGIIHRDIKPDNIFLHKEPNGEKVKVLDFGIAKLLGDSAANAKNKTLTKAGSILGTPNYMSPERLSHKPYDGKADVYSVGIMLYEMLLGFPPFRADKEDFWSIISSHLTEIPSSIVERNPTIPKEIENIVFKALSKDPENRPTAKELGETFAKIAGFDKDTDESGLLVITQEMSIVRVEANDVTTKMLTPNTPQVLNTTSEETTSITKLKSDSF